ncbi:hypothetical protein EVAR_74238_1 [Eumeta japonica]|uniref:Uncharacterized protein n=1 Tax=Eumeta variegata TaxID=151549 RepID=A0A4C1SCE4_EUMVA|nr:hypothetical protein EVAR_74238_1 [Eumeta japonica]
MRQSPRMHSHKRNSLVCDAIKTHPPANASEGFNDRFRSNRIVGTHPDDKTDRNFAIARHYREKPGPSGYDNVTQACSDTAARVCRHRIADNGLRAPFTRD